MNVELEDEGLCPPDRNTPNQLRARVTELEKNEAAIRAELLKYIEEPVDASETTLALAAEVVQEAIISRDLADKPPVVPAGWRVSLFAGSWRLQKPEQPVTPSEAAAAFRALAHAIETDQYPHHKDDEGAKDEDPRAIMGLVPEEIELPSREPFEAHPFEALKRWADSELGVWPRGFGVMYDGQIFTVRATEGPITTRKAGRDLAECVKGITK